MSHNFRPRYEFITILAWSFLYAFIWCLTTSNTWASCHACANTDNWHSGRSYCYVVWKKRIRGPAASQLAMLHCPQVTKPGKSKYCCQNSVGESIIFDKRRQVHDNEESSSQTIKIVWQNRHLMLVWDTFARHSFIVTHNWQNKLKYPLARRTTCANILLIPRGFQSPRARARALILNPA